MDSSFGFDKLKLQLFDYISEDWEWLADSADGDSKIEKLLFRALVVRSWCGATEFNDLVVARTAEDEARLKLEGCRDLGSSRLIVRPQAKIGERRVDFLIHAMDWRGARPDWHWRPLIVECDGHDFHNKTKAQVAKDRSKDRASTLGGVDFFRFTGAEIWRNPWGCAQQVTDWAIQWWPQ